MWWLGADADLGEVVMRTAKIEVVHPPHAPPGFDIGQQCFPAEHEGSRWVRHVHKDPRALQERLDALRAAHALG